MLLIAQLTIRRSELETFRAYEHAAARVMARYGGSIEHVFVVDEGDAEELREIHVVRFPDEAALEAYRNDPELEARGEERERAVLETEIWPAKDGPRYGSRS